MSWTEERVDLLKRLWTEGLSASQIAGKLGGVTRNAVIGKVHRLGLSGRATPAKPQRGRDAGAVRAKTASAATAFERRPTRLSAAPRQSAPEPNFIPPVVLDSGERTTVATLKSGMCKWPIGDPAKDDFHFCGQQADLGKPYCAYHARLAYQPSYSKRAQERREAVAQVATSQTAPAAAHSQAPEVVEDAPARVASR
ncbi:MAG: GcrA family cell cycle regulator [Pseudomonadota bacterium]